jgi:LPPG:FO 2-phospho-L-lactate transferase
MMRELGREVSARGVAMEYYRFIDGFVIDHEDEAFLEGMSASGFEVVAAPTFMRSVDDRVALANTVLDFAHALAERRRQEKEDAA